MRLRKNQAGFAIVEVVLVVVLLGVLGFVAVKAYTGRQSTTSSTTGQVSKVTDVPTVPSINTTADLTASEQSLDQTDLDAAMSDSSELDNEISDL